ncbi:MAG: HlyD family efflux transporter periplasmic adaptor subunit, partial [Woeseiaceae bacterium]|nr:HlyD family efflux transporter periplasmic adaptor subunit [Woeseiaceae bacterium]
SARDIKIGQHVDVDDATFRITDTSKLVAYLRIPQTELQKFSAGHPAKVQVDAMPGQAFAATIARISPTID